MTHSTEEKKCCRHCATWKPGQEHLVYCGSDRNCKCHQTTPSTNTEIERIVAGFESMMLATGSYNPNEPIYGAENTAQLKSHQEWLRTQLHTLRNNIISECEGEIEELKKQYPGGHETDIILEQLPAALRALKNNN